MQGIYKIENNRLIWAATKVDYPDGTSIIVEEMRNSLAEVDGWRWFNNRDEAKEFYNYEDEEINNEPKY
jgi:hypothetical protein